MGVAIFLGGRWKQSAGRDEGQNGSYSAVENLRSPGFHWRCQVTSLPPTWLRGGREGGGGGGGHTLGHSPPTHLNCAPCCRLCSALFLQPANFQSRIYSRLSVSQCKLICVDKQGGRGGGGAALLWVGLVRPPGSVFESHRKNLELQLTIVFVVN